MNSHTDGFKTFMDDVLGTGKVELTRDAIDLARAYMELPANERAQFKEAIAARAFDWSSGTPAIWPMRLEIVREMSSRRA